MRARGVLVRRLGCYGETAAWYECIISNTPNPNACTYAVTPTTRVDRDVRERTISDVLHDGDEHVAFEVHGPVVDDFEERSVSEFHHGVLNTW
jgi:hypothetical protein